MVMQVSQSLRISSGRDTLFGGVGIPLVAAAKPVVGDDSRANADERPEGDPHALSSFQSAYPTTAPQMGIVVRISFTWGMAMVRDVVIHSPSCAGSHMPPRSGCTTGVIPVLGLRIVKPQVQSLLSARLGQRGSRSFPYGVASTTSQSVTLESNKANPS